MSISCFVSLTLQLDSPIRLGCDDSHGGILRVIYDPVLETYTSRSVEYPEGYDGHRTGSFAGHDDAELIISNFAVRGGASHLMAFSTDDMSLSESQILPLPATQCGYAYEKGSAEVVLVFMPTGSFHVFEYHDGEWEEVAMAQVVEGMGACSEALFVPGVTQAFVLVKEAREIHSIDLQHLGDGGMEIHTSALGFTPFDATVAGAPKELACELHLQEHDHGSGGFSVAASTAAVAVTIVALISAVDF